MNGLLRMNRQTNNNCPTFLNYVCDVPDPPTGEEDATMLFTIRETNPMNMCIHKNTKMLKPNALN